MTFIFKNVTYDFHYFFICSFVHFGYKDKDFYLILCI